MASESCFSYAFSVLWLTWWSLLSCTLLSLEISAPLVEAAGSVQAASAKLGAWRQLQKRNHITSGMWRTLAASVEHRTVARELVAMV